MKKIKKLTGILICVVMLFVYSPVSAVTNEIEIIKTLYSGEAKANAWSTAATINITDTSFLTSENMICISYESNAAPLLALSSWSGGEAWASLLPCKNVDGKLYYSYEDMTASFGDDLSLVDSISVMSQNVGLTLYEVTVVSADSVTAADNQQSKGVKRVVGYLSEWSYSYYKTMDFDAVTHINIAFCVPDKNGNLFCNIPDEEIKNIVNLAHQNNVSVLASIGCASISNYHELISTKESMDSLNKKLMDYCEKFDLDGIDLDIEADVDKSFWNYYEDWCVSLRSLCDEKDLLMTTATACWLSTYASSRSLNCFDFLNIMAYDNDTDDSSHSDYDFAKYSLEYFNIQRGISKDKLVLGVPFYGRGYNEDGSLSWTSYVPFSELIETDTANYNRDLYNGIAYNGAPTMKEKCALASEYGGIMIWEITQDTDKEEYSLLQVIKNEILSEDNLIKGDINCDGAFNDDDLKYMRDYLLCLHELNEKQYERADVNEDGAVDSFDLIELRKLIAK